MSGIPVRPLTPPPGYDSWEDYDADQADAQQIKVDPAHDAPEVSFQEEPGALERQVAYERRVRLARRIVRDEEQVEAADFDAIDVTTAAELVRRERPERVKVLGDIVLEGHNATVTARFKTGKSTFVENMAAAITSGGRFLARYDVPEPLRVVLLNYEIDEEDMTDRIARLDLDAEAMERLLVVNLRGRRLPMMTDVGRAWLVKVLDDHGAQVLVVDPFGAAYAAAGGESENDNAEVRRFVLALDEVKEAASCRTLVMPIHTGRAEQVEGQEHGRGATVLDDWPDVRMLLTSIEGNRFLRIEGRREAQRLNESRLQYDADTHGLWLDAHDVGLGRRQAKAASQAAEVVDLVEKSPGMNNSELEAALSGRGITYNDDKREAIQRALLTGQIHRHAKGRAQLHYPGEIHPDEQLCEGGF